MTIAVAADTGPLTYPGDLPLSALVGPVDDVAAWLAYVGLEGRYAVVRKPGPGRQEWRRYAGGRWRRCDERLVRAAVRYALDDGYHRLTPDATATAYRLDRLLDPGYVDGPLWTRLVGVLAVRPERLDRA